jgi:hypothetical protein
MLKYQWDCFLDKLFDINSVLWWLHHVVGGDDADVSEVPPGCVCIFKVCRNLHTPTLKWTRHEPLKRRIISQITHGVTTQELNYHQ